MCTAHKTPTTAVVVTRIVRLGLVLSLFYRWENGGKGKQTEYFLSHRTNSWWSQIWGQCPGRNQGESRNFYNQGDLTLKLRGTQRLAEYQDPWQLDVEGVGTAVVLTSETSSALATSSTNPTIAMWSWPRGQFPDPHPTPGGEQGDRWCWYSWRRARTWHIHFENNDSVWVQKERNQFPFIEYLLSARPHPILNFTYNDFWFSQDSSGVISIIPILRMKKQAQRAYVICPSSHSQVKSNAGNQTQLWPTSETFSPHPPPPTPTLFPSASYSLPHVHSSLTLRTHCVPHTGWVLFGQAVLTGSAHLPGKGRVSAGRSLPASRLRPREAVSHAAVPGASRQLFLGCSKLGMLSSGKTRKQRG